MPEFIFVDGGITQRQIAERVLKRFKLDIPVAGVSKGPKRKLAKIVASEKARKWLNDRRLTNQLMEPIARLARDEAHRFAINYHRKLRAQSIN